MVWGLAKIFMKTLSTAGNSVELSDPYLAASTQSCFSTANNTLIGVFLLIPLSLKSSFSLCFPLSLPFLSLNLLRVPSCQEEGFEIRWTSIQSPTLPFYLPDLELVICPFLVPVSLFAKCQESTMSNRACRTAGTG